MSTRLCSLLYSSPYTYEFIVKALREGVSSKRLASLLHNKLIYDDYALVCYSRDKLIKTILSKDKIYYLNNNNIIFIREYGTASCVQLPEEAFL